MNYVAALSWRDFTETAGLGAGVIAQDLRGSGRQQETIAAGERDGIWNPFHAQPAVAPRNHAEMRQFRRLRAGGMPRVPFCLLRLAHQTPRRCGFQPGVNRSRHMHRLENVCYWVQFDLPGWTIRQIIWTSKQIESIALDIYSSGFDE